MRGLIQWLTQAPAAPICENPKQESAGSNPSKKPSKEIMQTLLEGGGNFQQPYQYANWAAERLAVQDKFQAGDKITVRAYWLIYEACRLELENERI